jgi:ribose transport system permease protein
LKIPSIVATLVVGALAYGFAYLITDTYGQASQIRMIVPALRQIWKTSLIGLPLTVWLMFLVYALVFVVLNHTRLGAHLYALGANRDAAFRAGIKVNRLIVIVMMVLALTTGFANLLFNARGMAAGPNLSPALTASGAGIAITLVGALFAGIGLFGGTGRVEFTLVGLLFFSILLVGMAVINFPAQIRVAVDGIAIILALLLDSLRRYYASR